MLQSDMKKSAEKRDWKMWFKRLGVLGFLFFLVKGLIWIGVFLFAGKAILD